MKYTDEKTIADVDRKKLINSNQKKDSSVSNGKIISRFLEELDEKVYELNHKDFIPINVMQSEEFKQFMYERFMEWKQNLNMQKTKVMI